jgi:hypothetical protein
MDRSSASSRWASPQSYHAPRVVVSQSSFNIASHDIIHDDDIDMEAMDVSPVNCSQNHSSKDVPIYRRLTEEPLENFIKNLQYDDVLTRGAGYVIFVAHSLTKLMSLKRNTIPRDPSSNSVQNFEFGAVSAFVFCLGERRAWVSFRRDPNVEPWGCCKCNYGV